jgi:hypothetical protein
LRSSEERKKLDKKVGMIRRLLILRGAKAFDVAQDYPKYSVGKELSVQKASLLQTQDFVMIN